MVGVEKFDRFFPKPTKAKELWGSVDESPIGLATTRTQKVLESILNAKE